MMMRARLVNEDVYYEPRGSWSPLVPTDDQIGEFEKIINEEFPITTPDGREDWWFIDEVESFPANEDDEAWFIRCTNDNGKKRMTFRSTDLIDNVSQDGALSSHESESSVVWRNPGLDEAIQQPFNHKLRNQPNTGPYVLNRAQYEDADDNKKIRKKKARK